MRLALGASALVLVLAACGSPAVSPSPSAAQPAPTAVPPASVAPSPSSAPPAAGFAGGVRLDLAASCKPVEGELLPGAVEGLVCNPSSDTVRRVQIYRFDKAKAMMAAYGSLITAQDIESHTHQGRCRANRTSEGAYVPGDDVDPNIRERSACYVDDRDRAHYIATAPPKVLIIVDGKVDDIGAVEAWSWLGNQDQPGNPTVWRDGAAVDPNA